jgi:hypothetical protein
MATINLLIGVSISLTASCLSSLGVNLQAVSLALQREKANTTSTSPTITTDPTQYPHDHNQSSNVLTAGSKTPSTADQLNHTTSFADLASADMIESRRNRPESNQNAKAQPIPLSNRPTLSKHHTKQSASTTAATAAATLLPYQSASENTSTASTLVSDELSSHENVPRMKNSHQASPQRSTKSHDRHPHHPDTGHLCIPSNYPTSPQSGSSVSFTSTSYDSIIPAYLASDQGEVVESYRTAYGNHDRGNCCQVNCHGQNNSPTQPTTAPPSATSTKFNPKTNALFTTNICQNDHWIAGLWFIGLTIYILCQMFGSVLALGFIPPILIAPLGSAGLIFNIIFSNLFFQSTKITHKEWIGTLLIVAGSVVVSIFGSTEEQDRQTIDELIRLFTRPTFIIYFSIQIAVMTTLFLAATLAENRHLVMISRKASRNSLLHPSTSSSTLRRTSIEHGSTLQGSIFKPKKINSEKTPLLAESQAATYQTTSTISFNSNTNQINTANISIPNSTQSNLIPESSILRRSSSCSLEAGTASMAASIIEQSRISKRNVDAGVLYAVVGGIAASETLLLAKSGYVL